MSSLITNYAVDCTKDSIGGISKMRIANKCDLDPVTPYTVVNGIITGINMLAGKQFYSFNLIKNTSHIAQALTASEVNGTVFYAQSGTLILNKLRATTSALVDNLARNLLVMIVEDKNGEVVLLGKDNGLDVSGGTITTGTASGDRNGYELQFKGEEKYVSHIDPTIIAGLLIPKV